MPRRRARRAAIQALPTGHHVQARVSDDVRHALAQLAAERGVTASEIVRDAVEAYLFGSKPGATMEGPDHGYRIAKSTAQVIARQLLYNAYRSMPESWEEFKAQVERAGEEMP